MKIHKGDNVVVLTGKDKGKKAKVLLAFPKKDMVLVEGVNMKKRHERPRASGKKGQIVERANPLHVSNVALVDPSSGRGTRVRMDGEGKSKARIAKSGVAIK